MKLSPTLRQRFFARVVWYGDCLLWRGTTNKVTKYGVLSIAAGISRGAHTVAFFLEHGRWPERLRHTCDNTLCCNPAHLIEGSQQDNMDDKVARGREAHGESHGMTKVSSADVMEIRRLRAEGFSLKSLSARFDTCQSNVSAICCNVTRKKA